MNIAAFNATYHAPTRFQGVYVDPSVREVAGQDTFRQLQDFRQMDPFAKAAQAVEAAGYDIVINGEPPADPRIRVQFVSRTQGDPTLYFPKGTQPFRILDAVQAQAARYVDYRPAGEMPRSPICPN